MPRRHAPSPLLLAAALAGCGPHPAPTPAAEAPPAPPAPAARAPGYDLPPENVLRVLHAPSPAQPSLSPLRNSALLIAQVQYPPMSQVAEPYLKLAGVRLEPRTRRKHDTPGGYGVAPCAQTVSFLDLASGKETPIALPPGGCVDGFTWAVDGERFAFRNTSRDAVELWLGDETGAIHRVGTFALNPMLGSTVQWMPDQQHLLVKLVPEDPGPPPALATGEEGPSIQETEAGGGEFSTYEARDTLTNKNDEDLFEYYGTSQLALVDATTGAVTRIGEPAVLDEVAPAPDGEHVLVTSITRPYSYAVTYGRFAHDVDVWTLDGEATKLASLPIADHVPVHGVPTGPRGHEWRPTEPATLVWAEALDGGDWNTEVPARDKVMVWTAPFTGDPTELTRTEQRFAGFDWSEQRGAVLLHEDDENRHWTRTWQWNVDQPGAERKLLWDLSSDDVYAAPGSPLYRVQPNGQWVMRQEGSVIFLRGTGSSPEGDRPFLDRLDLATSQTRRLFRSGKDSFEYVIDFTAANDGTYFTWHQSPRDPPNLFVRTPGAAVPDAPAGEAGVATTSVAVTSLPDPTPEVRGIGKRLVKYRRDDGLELSFTLYTPPGYVDGTRLPAILSAYPLDYASAATAGQVRGSEQTFDRLRSYQLLLLNGYAIIDRAAFPIVGDPKKAYDTYIEQLTADAKAAVDTAVGLGVVDPDRLGVTGHSHGALMTVNLLAHTDLFRAGVATSGSYNKTLTPFGFQNERRSVWNATDVYLRVSPFFYADRLKLPLLLVHGAEDANPGTTPLQATKLFEAIRGNGGTARLVMLPHEPHWYTAMESNEQLAYEELRWFDEHVKNAPPRTK